MANLVETARWEAGIYQFETSDPVMGGPNGIDNRPTRELANRTLWLKTELAAAVQSIGSNKTAADAALALKADRARTLTAGAGLTGGGDLSANRTIGLATPSTLSGSTVNWAGNGATGHTHEIAKATPTLAGVVKLVNGLDSTATDAALTAAQGKALAEQIAAADNTLALKVDKTTQVMAGNGLIGGGTLEASRMISLGVPSTITANSTNAAATNSHTHAIDKASTTTAGIVQLNNTLSSDATNQALTAAQGKILQNTKLGNSGNQTISNGNLTVGDPAVWMKLNFPVLNGAQWILETNPSSALDADGTVRINFRFVEGGVSRYISFPHVGGSNEQVAYQSWVKSRVDALDGSKVSTSTQIIAGNGLVGGGALDASRMISIGTPGTITGTSGNTTTATSHTHAIAAASTSAAGVVQLSTATNSTATNMAATPSAVKSAYDLASMAAPSGLIVYYGGTTAPPGWLKCNGAAISRTAYSDLFAAIGTYHGAGNGSTTFNLPDHRGEFIRGWDDGRGVDRGRVLGSAQGAALGAHNHLMFDATAWGVSDTTNDLNATGYALSRAWQGTAEKYNIKGSGTAPNAALTSTTGGTETRPQNKAALAIIKI